MKTILLSTCVVLALGASLSFSKAQGPDDTAKKLEALENDLLSTRQKAEAISAELIETKGVLAKTLLYLDAQAKSAASMQSTLDESERAGFTYGINPESRQVLLRGWREQLTAMQSEVPSLVVPKADDVKTKK